jgi:hypothetical protein
MSNHASASTKSAMFCDHLSCALRYKIPDLQIRQNYYGCMAWNKAAVIAWISHGIIWGSVRVWFIGNEEDVIRFPASAIALRTAAIPGSGANCCSSFKISKEDQIREAVELLYTVPYPRSINSLDSRQASTSYKNTTSIDRYETNQRSHLVEQKG